MHIPTIMLPRAKEDDSTCVVGKLAGVLSVRVAPVGKWYEAYCLRRLRKETISQHSLLSSSSEEDVSELREGDEEADDSLLHTLNPKDWKNQDHYAVLGLDKLRYNASENQIKRAYKQKVLLHHPDKRRARGLPVKDGEEDYFTCITRAWETLGNRTKKRSYDSVDPEFDDSVPSICAESRDNFYKVFQTVFEKNARWSNKKLVPKLGDENMSFEDVNNFYSFWYDFDSWREYSYLDEEEKEKGENRDERRWIEKQNKAARQKRKKEEIIRLRQLVDNAYACDPRIAKHKQDEKDKKAAVKQAKRDAARAKVEEEQRLKQEAIEEARQKKEKEEEEAKLQAAAAKKEKEAQKKILKRERKLLRTKLKDFEFFAETETERVNNMQEVDRLAELLSTERLQSLNELLATDDREKAKEAFFEQVGMVNREIEEEKQRQLELSQRTSSAKSEGGGGAKGARWSEEETEILIKAVNLFPAGTMARWETVASFLEQHVVGSKRTAKEVLFKAKDLQKNDTSLKQDANKKAFDKFAKEQKAATNEHIDQTGISARYDTVAEQQMGETGSNPAAWSCDEQKLLEQALKTFPASTDQRWERIAETIPSRSKRDCMKRYKELVELIRSKKAAQESALKNRKGQ